VNNIKINFREIGWNGMDCIDMAEDGDQCRGPCRHGYELLGALNFWEVLN
jgi:hypothetical protein